VAHARTALDERALGVDLGVSDPQTRPLREWLRRDVVEQNMRARHDDDCAMQEAIDEAVYAPYLDRQASEIAARERDKAIPIAGDFSFSKVPGLSTEMIERLSLVRPGSIDEASRIAGVTPAALSALHFALVREAA
jgi:tRNA uridine 5-carboxymethylaminomethyl modification enzyme